MKNKFPALLVIVALFGMTATAAEAHTVSHPYQSNHFNHYSHPVYHCYNGRWYDENGILVDGPGFVFSIGF